MFRSFIVFGRWAPARPSTKCFVFVVKNFSDEKKIDEKCFDEKIGRNIFGRAERLVDDQGTHTKKKTSMTTMNLRR